VLTGIYPGTIKPGMKCGLAQSGINARCPNPLDCQGYMGTSANVMSGICQKSNT
jgi:hypothetical protein